jgi:hypothetical protein
MKIAACFLLIVTGMCSAVLADEPPAPPAVAPQAAAPPAAAPQASAAQAPAPQGPALSVASSSDSKPAPSPAPAPAAAPGAPKIDKTELASVGPTEAEIKQMRGRGFKPVTRNGTTVFCREEGEIGTHFPRTRCSTLDQLKQAELTGKEYVNSIQQQGSAVPFKGP